MIRFYRTNYRKTHIFLLMGILLIGTTACDSGQEPMNKTFDRASMLRNIGEKALIPAHTDFTEQTAQLESLAKAFAQSPSEQALTALQNHWIVTKKSWKHCEVFNISEARELFLHNKIDKWPTKTSFLEDNLAGTDLLTEQFVENSGSTSKGLPALEHFLFDADALTKFTSDSLASRRLIYVEALTANLHIRAAAIQQLWEDNLEDFVSNTENFAASSVNQLVNAQCAVLEKVLNDKLGKPLGKDSGGTPEPDEVEAYLSKVSLSLIKENLLGVQLSFQGDPAQLGLDELLDFLEAKHEEKMLASAILTKLQACLDKIDLIADPLSESVLNQQQELEELYELIRDLLGFIKVDMSNHLAITITFKETDGD